jgi:hypothetical protein
MVTVAVVGSVSVGVIVSKSNPLEFSLLKSQMVLIFLLSFFDVKFFMALMFWSKLFLDQKGENFITRSGNSDMQILPDDN